jgi:two-component system cell cycle sensor histidine kinase/response regulator CckA
MSGMQTFAPLAIAAVAHDLKNMLLVLELNTAMLPTECRTAAPQAIEQMQHALKRATSLAHQLLEQARASATREPAPTAETVELGRVVVDAAQRFARLVEPQVRVIVEASGAPSTVVAPRELIDRVLLELLLNARDAMPDGGTVRVTVEHGAGEARVTVHDSGTGMDEQVRARLFQPFFTTKGERGSGLGLYSVWTDVTSMGGRISVHTERGEGTRFIIALPAAAVSPPR